MEDKEFLEQFKLDIKDLGDRRRQVMSMFPPRPEEDAQPEALITMWHRECYLSNNVYLDKSSPSGQLRVVKQLVPRGGLVASCYSELQAMARVARAMECDDRQLFVQFLGWFESPDHVCFVMEYCRYGDISQCFPNPVSEEEAREICAQLLEGLYVLHGLKITHRDIKAQNVLVAQRDPVLVKITDFGISKHILEGETELRTRAGTEGYMAPEVLGLVNEAQEDSRYTNAVDVWSLGCLIYYTLTKQTPFPKYNMLRDYSRGLCTYPESLLIERGVGPSGISFLGRLMSLKPEVRPEASPELITEWMLTPQRHSQSPHQSTHIQPETETYHHPNQDLSRRPTAAYTPSVTLSTDSHDIDLYSSELWHSLKSSPGLTGRIRPLLDRADPNKFIDGCTALHLAAAKGPAEAVQVLLEYGADVTLRTRPDQETALHLSTLQADPEVYLEKLHLILARGADINAQDVVGNTPLHLAIVRFGSHRVFEVLISLGASLALRGNAGFTPLHYALHLGQEKKATVLLHGGADPNASDATGRTALHLAIASNRITVGFIEALIEQGADINREDNYGESPFSVAMKSNRMDVTRLLSGQGTQQVQKIPKRLEWARFYMETVVAFVQTFFVNLYRTYR